MTQTLAIRNGKVLVGDQLVATDVVLRNSTIDLVGTTDDSFDATIDAEGLIVAPGFIDLQINGGFGTDFLENPEEIWDVGRQLLQHGVTTFLPTIITASAAQRDDMLATLRRRPENYVGAEPLGVHFEGPMLNSTRVGAHDSELLVLPSAEVIAGWSRDAGVRLVTIAPELPGSIEVIQALKAAGVSVSAGHSNATAAEAFHGFDSGITMTTHLFNAMAPFEHRSPNLAGATLACCSIVACLIVDGIHVAPTTVAAAWQAKSAPDSFVLVTDAVAAMGRPPGDYTLGETIVRSDGLSVRTLQGTLAGSALTMNRAVRLLETFTGCGVEAALNAASRAPARAIRAQERGAVVQGHRGDICLLDESYDVHVTISGGHVGYASAEGHSRLTNAVNLQEGLY